MEKTGSPPQFALNFSTRIANFLDRLLYPFLALARLVGFVPDFIVLTAGNTPAVLATASARPYHR
jgi:hypothetical protein